MSSPRKMSELGGLALLLTALCLCCRTTVSAFEENGGDSVKEQITLSYQQGKMGTLFKISIDTTGTRKEAADAAAEKAYALIDDLNQKFSDYLPESELSLLCKAPAGEPYKVSAELLEVLQLAKQTAERTDGAFDFTAGNLTNLWRRSKRKDRLPDPADLADAKLLTGHELVSIDTGNSTVTLKKQGMLLDLGGIAKGYAADAAIQLLKENGFPRSIIAAGGDIAVGDAPSGMSGWTVYVAALDAAEGEKRKRYRLANCGISTSGDTSQYVEIGGKRYSHIVDPRTGLGLTDRIGVTVIAPDATTSDSHATAASVLGWEKGRKFVGDDKKLRGRFVRPLEAAETGFQAWTTADFPAEYVPDVTGSGKR